MRKSVFLAFSAFLIPCLASAKDFVTVSCPSAFPMKATNNKSLPLAGMGVWAGAVSLQIPDSKDVNDITDNGLWEIHCKYDNQHQIIIEVPKGSLYCAGTGETLGKRKDFCMGPKAAVPTTPPPMFVSQPVDYTATLQGFGLRQTAQQILAEAQRQGLWALSRAEATPGGGQRTRIDIAAPNPLVVWLSPQTQLSVEVRQDFPKQQDPQQDQRQAVDVIGPHLFGDFSSFLPHDGLFWDRKTGVLIISKNREKASPDNYIRLLDDGEISKESGQPTGYKKYVAP